MHNINTQHPSTIDASFPPRPAVLLTVRQFSERNPAFTEASLRNLIFKAQSRQSSKGVIPGNGLVECGAIIRISRKILVNEKRFFEWINKQQTMAGSL